MAKDKLDIASNIKAIEQLKINLLENIALLYKEIDNADAGQMRESVKERLAGLVGDAYLLARRLGVDFCEIDVAIENRIEEQKRKNSELEKNFGDLSAFLHHFERKE